MNVKFYKTIEDNKLLFAVIVAKYNGKWLFCKHKERSTYEIPGGHREYNESILDCAKRELEEESGATKYTIYPICVYSCMGKTRVKESREDIETFGMLYYANIEIVNPILNREMQEIKLFDNEEDVDAWTYPTIQPILLNYVKEYISENKNEAF